MATTPASDQVTWIPVVGDAVKIGLGALIGGFFAFLTLLRSQRHDFRKEIFIRRLDRMETIARAVYARYESYLEVWSTFRTFDNERGGKADVLLNQIQQQKITELLHKGLNATSQLHEAESLARLYGLREVHRCLVEYREAMTKPVLMMTGNMFRTPPPLANSMIDIARDVERKRDAVLDELSKQHSL